MTGYNPGIHTSGEGEEFALQNPEAVREQLEQERTAVENIDLDSPAAQHPHQHETHRSKPFYQQSGASIQVCACGAQRNTNLVRSTRWIGGAIPETPWEKAHLEAVRRAVADTPPLLDVHPEAVRNINSILTQDPPEGTGEHGREALASIYGIARGAAHRLLDWQQKHAGDRGDPGETKE